MNEGGSGGVLTGLIHKENLIESFTDNLLNAGRWLAEAVDHRPSLDGNQVLSSDRIGMNEVGPLS